MTFTDWKKRFEASILFNFGLTLEDVGWDDDMIILMHDNEDNPSAAAHQFGKKYGLTRIAIKRLYKEGRN